MESGVLYFAASGKAHRRDFAFLMVQGGIYGKSPDNISTTFCKENTTVPAQPFLSKAHHGAAGFGQVFSA